MIYVKDPITGKYIHPEKYNNGLVTPYCRTCGTSNIIFITPVDPNKYNFSKYFKHKSDNENFCKDKIKKINTKSYPKRLKHKKILSLLPKRKEDEKRLLAGFFESLFLNTEDLLVVLNNTKISFRDYEDNSWDFIQSILDKIIFNDKHFLSYEDSLKYVFFRYLVYKKFNVKGGWRLKKTLLKYIEETPELLGEFGDFDFDFKVNKSKQLDKVNKLKKSIIIKDKYFIGLLKSNGYFFQKNFFTNEDVNVFVISEAIENFISGIDISYYREKYTSDYNNLNDFVQSIDT
jgi:hypothetical protein